MNFKTIDQEFEEIWSEMAKEDRKYLLYPSVKNFLHSKLEQQAREIIEELILFDKSLGERFKSKYLTPQGKE